MSSIMVRLEPAIAEKVTGAATGPRQVAVLPVARRIQKKTGTPDAMKASPASDSFGEVMRVLTSSPRAAAAKRRGSKG